MSAEVEDGDVATSKKPKESKFYQQKLWAWQPILTASNICPYFYIVAILFIPLGAFFLATSNGVAEISIPYTHCVSSGSSGTSCAEHVKDPSLGPCQCTVNFTLDADLKGPLYVFYGLTNFFQNHRRYVMSRDDEQLNGKPITVPSVDCEPYRYNVEGGVKKIIAPCGAIANSLFNDTFVLRLVRNINGNIISSPVEFSMDNIAWKSDRDVKFGRPTSWENTTKPINWPKPVQEITSDAYSGYSQLLVWMRTAALPNFRKNYADIVQKGEFVNGLPAGYYEVDIDYSYPVTQFSGTKRFIISQASWLGGRNPTLGIAYIVVGCIHAVLAVIFTGIHFHLRRRRRGRL
ncbi:Cell cycle control protein 50A [Taenia crassiceps]|uniref:Cell cycle control protein 50A n=1 Tax=Taenia crassiceps TaxID=6207 RepID=A0ABR4QR54_9CEST